MGSNVDFGCDFLHLMRELQTRASESGDLDVVADAAARLFLVQWGLSVAAADEANQLFWARFNEEALDPLPEVAQRVAQHVGDDRAAREQLVVQLAAIGCMDFNITDHEASFVRWFQDAFDLRPSEFTDLCQRGFDLAVALDFFGTKYLEAKGK